MRKLIGFEELIKNFNTRCLNDSLSHAHLITGEDGIGKSILAKTLGKLILKGDLDREYVDIIDYKLTKASFGVDEVRGIISEVNKKPFEGDRKVIIIHQGDKLTVQAQNALLKTIEEPPAGVYIIILCENLEVVLDTIKSRCEIYKLTPLSKGQLHEYIKIKEFNKSDDEIKSAIAFSGGVPGKIDRYFNDESLGKIRDTIVDLLHCIIKNDLEEILKLEEILNDNKKDRDEVLEILNSYVRDIMIHKEIENEEFIINGDKINHIKEFTREMSFRRLDNMIKKIIEAKKNIKSNINWGMTLRVMLMGFMEV